MAIVIKATTQKDQKLPLVSVHDDAIDTNKCDVPAYIKAGHVLENLQFVEGKEPTVFWFVHPKRADARRILTDILLDSSGQMRAGSALQAVWENLFEGVSEGLLGAVVKPKINADYIQGLHDAGVFQELANAYMLRSQENAVESAKKKQS